MRKPQSTVLVLGPRGHGKTTVALGLLRGSPPAGGSGPAEPATRDAAEVPAIALPRACELPVKLHAASIETTRRRYTLLDPGERFAARKRLLAGPLAGLPAIDGALLVVDPGRGLGARLATDLLLLRRVGVAGLVVLLNEAAPTDPERLDLAEYELREALCAAGLPGDAAPIVRGRALALLDGGPAGMTVAAALHEALDQHVPLAAERSPRLVVAAVLAAEIECRVLQPGLAPGQPIELVGMVPTRIVQFVSLTGVQGEPGQVGAPVRCAVRGAATDELRVGQVLALPGAIAAHARFEAEVWYLGHHVPAPDEWLFSFFEVITVGGVARPLAEGERAFVVELSTPVALAPGDGFGVVSQGALIGVGVVTAVRGASRKRRRGALSPAGVALSLVDTLSRGDRPDVAASCLFPPDDVVHATARAFAETVRPFVQTGGVLLRLVEDGRRSAKERSECSWFDYKALAGRPLDVEYLGLVESAPPRSYTRGQQVHVYFAQASKSRVTHEHWLTAGITLVTIRLRIQVAREGRQDRMIVQTTAAEFEVRKGTWYLFDLELPYAWQTL